MSSLFLRVLFFNVCLVLFNFLFFLYTFFYSLSSLFLLFSYLLFLFPLTFLIFLLFSLFITSICLISISYIVFFFYFSKGHDKSKSTLSTLSFTSFNGILSLPFFLSSSSCLASLHSPHISSFMLPSWFTTVIFPPFSVFLRLSSSHCRYLSSLLSISFLFLFLLSFTSSFCIFLHFIYLPFTFKVSLCVFPLLISLPHFLTFS